MGDGADPLRGRQPIELRVKLSLNRYTSGFLVFLCLCTGSPQDNLASLVFSYFFY